jgi:hypothetical protein
MLLSLRAFGADLIPYLRFIRVYPRRNYFFPANKVISIWDPATKFEMATQVRAGKTPLKYSR